MGLTIKQDPCLKLVSYTGYNQTFSGLCKDVEMAVSGLKTRHPIFIIKYRNYNLVFGQLFLNIVKFS